MNKQDLIDFVASRTGDSKAAAGRAVDAVLDAISHGLETHQGVSLVGFGSFAVKTRAARNGRNPQTGEPIYIPDSFSASFKPGKPLTSRLNGGK